uniref:Uncharacterized protein TCIL3000_10_9110 n=1 Tax=Trypanosoma congolense (strain IL3000) TaxID=1068625 RepID=G0UXL6_TRYCI|nr:unnamed protein product [Trypanosoma congolense IL3000]
MTDLLSLRVRLSVANPPVRRLIVCAGCCDDDQSGKTRGALGRLVARRLLETCSPSPSDIHNPDQNRMHARDAKGKARRGGGYRGRDQLWKHSSSYGGTRLREFGRNAQTWDSERVPDYMGLWCDRLLLGEHTTLQRCALLEPRVPLLMIGESLERVLLAHQHLKANDVLFVFGSCCSPFGVVKLVPFDDDLLSITHGGTPCWYQSIGSVLRRLQGERATASALVLGLGDKHGLHSPFEPEERSLVQSRIVPLLGFTCALWTLSPVKALEYLQSNPANNPRLWSTMQSSMLSTRDAAVLRALETGKTLDARLSQQHTIYLGETLLSRLFPPSQ